jgi:probable HAF family extracellular repeat protein
MLSVVVFLVITPMAAGSSANAANFSFTQIDVPGANRTFAEGINDAGQIVGAIFDSTSLHGFLNTRGSFTQIDVPVPGAVDTLPRGINDAGQIVGYFDDSTGRHGFLNTGALMQAQ